jgi:hypothetical protein
MAEPITVSDEEVASLLQVIFDQLREHRAIDVMHGLEESRLIGIEEDASKEILDHGGKFKKVGTTRRRAASNLDMIRIAFQELRQRLIVLPAIINALEQRLGTNQIVWRVDRQFVSPDVISTLEAKLDELRPAGLDQIMPLYEKVRELIPNLVPTRKTEVP